EAKFAVPDEPTAERLLALETLGEYTLVPGGQAWTTDRYVDTASRDLLQSGHACRRRIVGDGAPELVTVKALGDASGTVHRRPELELEVPPGAPPEQWPPGPPRDVVMGIAGDRPLVELLTLRQHRTMRGVMRRERRIAVLSLDRIEFVPGTTARELEIELGPGGRSSDLRAMRELLRRFELQPQPLSKFTRALALLDGRPPDDAVGASTVAAAPAGRRRGRRKVGVRADDSIVEAGRQELRYRWDHAVVNGAGPIRWRDPQTPNHIAES